MKGTAGAWTARGEAGWHIIGGKFSVWLEDRKGEVVRRDERCGWKIQEVVLIWDHLGSH